MKKYDVFISHSSKDRETVETIVSHLENNGIKCFVSYRDIPHSSTDWSKFLVDAIEASSMVVYVHTESSNSSEEVQREIHLCIDTNKMPCITYRLSAQPFSGGKLFFLQNLNWIDSLVDPTDGLEVLVKSVKDVLAGKNVESVKQKYNSFGLFIRKNKVLLYIAAFVVVCVFGGFIANNLIEQNKIKKAAELERIEFEAALNDYNSLISTANRLMSAKDSALVMMESIDAASKLASRYSGSDFAGSFSTDIEALRENAMSTISLMAEECRQRIINFNMTYQLVPMDEIKKDIELELSTLSEIYFILGRDFDNTISRIKASLGI